MTSLEVSFPRGNNNNNNSNDNSKTDGTAKSTAASHPGKKRNVGDFLFGSSSTIVDTPSSKQSSKKNANSSKRHKKSSGLVAGSATKTSNKSRSLLPLGGGAVVHPEGSHNEGWIEALGFSKLHAGFALLGVVREVHEDLVVFSLPNQWTGFMLRPTVGLSSDTATAPVMTMTSCDAMFPVVGEIMAVRIVKAVQEQTKTGPRRRIQVSALPGKVNSPTLAWRNGTVVRGQVTSIQDHGLLIDLGWQRQGFLRFDDIHGKYVIREEDGNDNEEEDKKPTQPNVRILGTGRILDLHVMGNDDASSSQTTTTITRLELLNVKEATKKLTISNLPPLEDLLPGTLVQCTVDKAVRNGLCVSFGKGVYRGAIDLHHLGGFWLPDHRQESKAWKDVFNKHQAFQARLIAVDAATKILRLSLQKHLLDMQVGPLSLSGLPAMGSVHEGTVVRLDEGIGALIALPDLSRPSVASTKGGVVASSELYEDESYQEASRVVCAYVHISKAITSPEKGRTPDAIFAKEFAPSTQHRVRILNTSNLVEGIVSGAAAPDIVDAKVLSYHDLEAGKLYKQVPICKHLDNGGIIVSFGMGITGNVPAIHLFDQNATNEFRARMRKVKYALKAKIDVRVLSVDPIRKKCTVTAKKSLVNETNVINDYQQVTVGQRSTGFVSKIDARGISVTFFNGKSGVDFWTDKRRSCGFDIVSHFLSGVFGRVTKRSLRDEMGLSSASDQYSVGDVVSCQVVQVKKKENPRVTYSDANEIELRPYYEITLSLREAEGQSEPQTQESDVHIRTGAVLPAKSLRVLELVNGKSKQGSFVPGYAIVEVKAKHVLRESIEGNKIECKLPYDQLFDEYDERWLKSPHQLDTQAAKTLVVGEKLDQKSLILTDPKKSAMEYKSGTGRLTLISLRPKLIQLIEKGADAKLLMPSPETEIYVGAKATPLGQKSDKSEVKAPSTTKAAFDIGDIIANGEVEKIDFNRATVKAPQIPSLDHEVRIHCTLAPFRKNPSSSDKDENNKSGLHPLHPFYRWKVGMRLPPLKVVDVQSTKHGIIVDVQVTAPTEADKSAKRIPDFIRDAHSLSKGQKVTGVVGDTGGANHTGVWVSLGPHISGFLPALEISDEEDIGHLAERFPRGSRIACSVLVVQSGNKGKQDRVLLTLSGHPSGLPSKGDAILGMINRKASHQDKCALMVDLQGGLKGRCCITELRDRELWTNLPLARALADDDEVSTNEKSKGDLDLSHGAILSFTVLDLSEKDQTVELSLRKSRMEGNLDDDHIPEVGEITQAYVVSTNKKGCFVRCSRNTNGRCILKELSDGFLSDPAASFPSGRLVVGKVTAARKDGKQWSLDLNLRESAVADAKKAVDLRDIEVGQKFQGIVSRIEDYGVFVQLAGSSVFGLVHKSECSDRFIKDVSKIYSPGDLVKVYVLKKDEGKKQVGLSMKASYFTEEDDADEKLSATEVVSSDDESMDEADSADVEKMEVDDDADGDDNEMQNSDEDETSEDENDDKSDSSEDSEDEEEAVESKHAGISMDMDVGFEWNAGAETTRAK
eukprot:scaffold3937_cov184-Amphora_coffeaeformis.AAC.2